MKFFTRITEITVEYPTNSKYREHPGCGKQDSERLVPGIFQADKEETRHAETDGVR
jgi:hypothetical protein